MAGEAVGFSLVIDEALIKRMEKAQEMITSLATKSEQARTRIRRSSCIPNLANKYKQVLFRINPVLYSYLCVVRKS